MRSKRNQFFCTVLMGLALGCLLTACGANENRNDQESVKENNENNLTEQETGVEETVASSEEKLSETEEKTITSEEQESVSEEKKFEAKESYEAVLLGKEDFINIDIADQHRKINLENIREVVSSDEQVTARATKFAIIDLDGDGEDEIVLWIQVNEHSDFGFEILYFQNQEVYGFTLWYRQFMELKQDGTFWASGGAADTKVCKLQLSEDGYLIEEIPEADIDESQATKENVEWYDLTEDNISPLSSMYSDIFLSGRRRNTERYKFHWQTLCCSLPV